jgi:hypothetical protein
MAQHTGPNIGLTWGWADGVAGWGGPTNTSLKVIDTLLMLGVISTTATPPTTPLEGDRYIVGPSATGIWAGKDNQIAAYVDAAWSYYPPKVGYTLRSAANGRLDWDGSAWVAVQKTYPNFGGSGGAHSAGLVPDPGATTGITKYLREDGSWTVPPDTNTTYSAFVASGAGHAAGLVPDPGATAGTTRYLREDGTWTVPPTGGGGGGIPEAPLDGAAYARESAGWQALAAVATTGAYADITGGPTTMVASGSTHKGGLVPDTPATVGTTKYLREDGSWTVPPDTNTTYATFVGSGSGHSGGLVPDPGATVGSTKYLREDGFWNVPPDTNTTYSPFIGSGGASTSGLVPSPGLTAGVTKYLREDATWVVPPDTTYSPFVGSGSGHTAGLVPDPGATAGTTRFLREDGTWAAPAGGGGGSTTLAALTDVALNSPGNTDVLGYAAATSKWVNKQYRLGSGASPGGVFDVNRSNTGTGLVTFSNGNRTVTATTSAGSGRIIGAIGAVPLGGKVYFEYKLDNFSFQVGYLGFGAQSTILDGANTVGVPGLDRPGMSVKLSTTIGDVVVNGSSTPVLTIAPAISSAGTILCIAYDSTLGKVWVRNGANNWNNDVIANQNPATGTGGISVTPLGTGSFYPTVIYTAAGDTKSINMGDVIPFSLTPPAGFVGAAANAYATPGDVQISNPTDGDVLIYDNTNKLWKNVASAIRAGKATQWTLATSTGSGTIITTPYPVNGELVIKNGVVLTRGTGADYTAIDGATITLAVALKAADNVTVIALPYVAVRANANVRTIAVTGSALDTDLVVKANAASAAIVYTLPDAAQAVGRVLYVKKIDSSANTVTVKGVGTQLIDSANTSVITAQWATIHVISDGTSWSVI